MQWWELRLEVSSGSKNREGEPGRAADSSVLALETKSSTSLPTPTGYVFGDLLGRALRTRFPASLFLKHDFGGRLLIPIRLREQVGTHLVLPLL